MRARPGLSRRLSNYGLRWLDPAWSLADPTSKLCRSRSIPNGAGQTAMPSQILTHVVVTVVAAAVAIALTTQCRKSAWLPGRLFRPFKAFLGPGAPWGES